MLKSKKAEVIEQLTTSFANTTAVVICDYKGLTVSQLEELRKAARAKDTSVQVVKNTLATIALNNAEMSGIEIKDTNIFIWSDDVINAAKIAENITAFLVAINKQKPASAKGRYIKNAALSLTMSPAVKFDLAELADIK